MHAAHGEQWRGSSGRGSAGMAGGSKGSKGKGAQKHTVFHAAATGRGDGGRGLSWTGGKGQWPAGHENQWEEQNWAGGDQWDSGGGQWPGGGKGAKWPGGKGGKGGWGGWDWEEDWDWEYGGWHGYGGWHPDYGWEDDVRRRRRRNPEDDPSYRSNPDNREHWDEQRYKTGSRVRFNTTSIRVEAPDAVPPSPRHSPRHAKPCMKKVSRTAGQEAPMDWPSSGDDDRSSDSGKGGKGGKGDKGSAASPGGADGKGGPGYAMGDGKGAFDPAGKGNYKGSPRRAWEEGKGAKGGMGLWVPPGKGKGGKGVPVVTLKYGDDFRSTVPRAWLHVTDVGEQQLVSAMGVISWCAQDFRGIPHADSGCPCAHIMPEHRNEVYDLLRIPAAQRPQIEGGPAGNTSAGVILPPSAPPPPASAPPPGGGGGGVNVAVVELVQKASQQKSPSPQLINAVGTYLWRANEEQKNQLLQIVSGGSQQFKAAVVEHLKKLKAEGEAPPPQPERPATSAPPAQQGVLLPPSDIPGRPAWAQQQAPLPVGLPLDDGPRADGTMQWMNQLKQNMGGQGGDMYMRTAAPLPPTVAGGLPQAQLMPPGGMQPGWAQQQQQGMHGGMGAGYGGQYLGDDPRYSYGNPYQMN